MFPARPDPRCPAGAAKHVGRGWPDPYSDMEEHQVRRLLVLEDGSNRAIGIISLGDIAVHAGRRGSFFRWRTSFSF